MSRLRPGRVQEAAGDLVMKVRVDVTEQDIIQGIRNNTHFCPIARAVSRVTRFSSSDLYVQHTRVMFCFTDAIEQATELPMKAQDFIRLFDAYKPVSPFSFDLEIPEAPHAG